MKTRVMIIAACIFGTVFGINLTNSLGLSESTKGRDFQYYAWQEMTSNTNFFEPVKDRDVMIANNQDDSFEYNAGTFYVNTGKRLAYFYKTSVLLPDLAKCRLIDKCTPPNVRETLAKTLPNLSRVSSVDAEDIDRDWVVSNLQPGALDKINIWATDLVLLTPNDLITYLMRFDDTSISTSLDISSAQVLMVTNGLVSFTPAFNGICLKKVSETYAMINERWIITRWVFPKIGVGPNGMENAMPESMDYRSVEFGSCAK
jgi:hypothetical protein